MYFRMEDNLHPNWKTLATSNLKWKVFVKAKNEGPVLHRDIRECSNALSLNGEEAKEVYEKPTHQNLVMILEHS